MDIKTYFDIHTLLFRLAIKIEVLIFWMLDTYIFYSILHIMDKSYVVLSVDEDGFICCSRCSMSSKTLNSQLIHKNRITFYRKQTLNPTPIRREFLKHFGKAGNMNSRSNCSISLTKNKYLAKTKLKQIINDFDGKLIDIVTNVKQSKNKKNYTKKSLKRKRVIIDLTGDEPILIKKQKKC